MSRSLLRFQRQVRAQLSVNVRTFTITSTQLSKTSVNSTPGWGGRGTEDHAVNRDGNDVQSDASQQAMKDRDAGKEGSGAISGKDERNANQRAKDDHPEAPGPVIGMNDERGGKS